MDRSVDIRFFRSDILTLALLTTTVLTALVLAGCGDEETTETGTVEQSGLIDPQEPMPNPEPAPGEPQPTEQASPYGPGMTEPQVVGTIMDGLQLMNIRWADHGTYFRVVFDMGTSGSEPVLQPPYAEGSLEDGGTEVRVLLGGVRSIGDLPNAQATEITIDNDLVISINRIPSLDDQAMLYAIKLTQPATYVLASLGAPGRVVVDIIKS